MRACWSPPAPAIRSPSPAATRWRTRTSPGTVRVQSSLGDITSNLLVINQAGGNCTGCGGLSVTAAVTGTPEQDGTYKVSWRSEITSPNGAYTPFIVRDQSGLELARLEYRNGGAGPAGAPAPN